MKNKAKINRKELDLGERKVSQMNFSKIVTLPKTFTENCLDDGMRVKMTMQRDGTLNLRPVCTPKPTEDSL